MNLFFSPGIKGDMHTLGEQESKHAVRVLRLGNGDPLQLVDGRGGWFEAVIVDAHPTQCRIRIRSHIPDYKPLPYGLHLAISPTKSMDRFEWFLEKATEIGITAITPLLCHRSERTRIKAERLERILVSAMKQSLRAYKPALNEAISLLEFLEKDHPGTRGIAHQDSSEDRGIESLSRNSQYTILVGPEGDFTEEEVQHAIRAGYTSFHLGESRLRTETAGVYICAAINLRFSH